VGLLEPHGDTMARITFVNCSITPPSTITACPPSTSTTWNRRWPSWPAADAVDAPVIIQASRGARSYANDIMLKHMMDAVAEIYPHIPVCVHLDHGNEPATCMTRDPGRLHLGDDGRLAERPTARPRRLGLQRRRHQAVTDMAHLGGISVEGELGVLGSLETAKARRKTATASRASCRTTSC
jgi:hypothetical protein